jgi:hypothetical protein
MIRPPTLQTEGLRNLIKAQPVTGYIIPEQRLYSFFLFLRWRLPLASAIPKSPEGIRGHRYLVAADLKATCLVFKPSPTGFGMQAYASFSIFMPYKPRFEKRNMQLSTSISAFLPKQLTGKSKQKKKTYTQHPPFLLL